MKRFILIPCAVFLTSCDQAGQEGAGRTKSNEPSIVTKRQRAPSNLSEKHAAVPILNRLSPEDRPAELKWHLFGLADDRIEQAMVAIEKVRDKESQSELLVVLHQDLAARDEIIRLPGLITIAQHEATPESLKTTIYADLRRDLGLAFMPDPDVFPSLVEQHLEHGSP